MSHSIVRILLLSLLVTGCNRQQVQPPPNTFAPKVTEAKGYVVPRDSISEPKVLPVGKPQVVQVGNPRVVPTSTIVHQVGKPKVVKAGTPLVCIPGQDGILLPKTVPVIGFTVPAGIPEVIVAKDPSNKEVNPQNFSYYGEQQGLKWVGVSCMVQDRNGNLWFGAGQGVSKFDGKSFTHYTKEEGLCTNGITAVIEDKTGNLWFGTSFGGVSRLSRDGKRFTHFTEKEGLSNSEVKCIAEDKNGNLWFGTWGSGAYRIDRDARSFTHYTMKEGLGNDIVDCMEEDKNGNLWFGTWGSGVTRLDQDGTRFTYFTRKEGLICDSVDFIEEDKSGNLWFGTYKGVSRLSRDGSSFTNFTEKEGLGKNEVWSILEDQHGNLWFSTWGGGVSRLDREGKNFTHFSEKEGLSNNNVECILEDKNGTLWFGTRGGGVSKYNGGLFTHFPVKEEQSKNYIVNISKDKSGDLWFCIPEGGVSRLSRDGRKMIHYTQKEGLISNYVSCVTEDKNGNHWIGTYDGKGVCRISRDGRTFTTFTETEGLGIYSVRCIFEDKNGQLWIGTDGSGVFRLSPDGKWFTNYTVKEGLSNNSVICILEDTSGNMWFGTLGGGATRLSPDGRTFTHFTKKEGLSDNYVLSLFQDKRGDLWFGTWSGGTSRLDRDGKSFTHYSVKEGLCSNGFTNIMEDKSGNLWFTGFGVSKLPLSAAEGKSPVLFKNYTAEDGFLGYGVNPGALCEDTEGTIWFGTTDRLTVYHPEGDIPDTISPNVQLTNLDLFTETIPWTVFDKNKDTALVLGNGVRVGGIRFDSLSDCYFLPVNLSLAHNNNFLTFKYVGITQKSFKKVKYQYKLEGFDENWSAHTTNTDAPYGNLPHGSYTFKVKAMNSDGYWSKEFHYPFTIRPPWYKTTWFRLLTVLFILFSLITVHHWRTASLRRRQKQLEKTIEERTAEVVHQKEEIEVQKEEVECQKEELENTLDKLKQTQSQLIQSEKMASLGMLTAGIAHEINNPVNFINSGAISLQKDYEDLQQIIKSIEKLPPETRRLADELGMDELLRNIPQTIEDIKTGVQRTSEIVQGLRNFTRMDASEQREADIHEGMESTLLLLNNKIKNRILIVKEYDDHIGFIKCYPGPLNQVFMNLLNNAIDAIDQKMKEDSFAGGEPNTAAPGDRFQIGITTKLLEEGIKKQVKIVITDNGAGIPEEIRDKLFDPFFTTKEVGKGTGLGLSICHGIIEKHGGSITFESKVNEGTAFTILLPGN